MLRSRFEAYVSDPEWLAGDLELTFIKTLCKQIAFSPKKEMAIRIFHSRIDGGHFASFASIQCGQKDAVHTIIDEEMLSVREEMRPAKPGGILLRTHGQGCHLTSGSGNPANRSAGDWHEHDDSAGAPGSAARIPCVRQDERSSRGHINPLEPAFGKETERVTVRRPECGETASRPV